VRGCGLPLTWQDRTLTCPDGHTYDLARSGYINLLQPQDRRSLNAGDAKAAIDARARLLDAGVGRPLLHQLVQIVNALSLRERAVVVDLGSGSGDALAAVTRNGSIAGIGIDLSTAAAEHAARRFPALTWVVANADRRLPLGDASVDLVMSVHARRNPAECARVLAPGSHLIVAVPAPDDLVELRAAVQGDRVEHDRADALIEEHQAPFVLQSRVSVREQRNLERDALLDLLRGTYRGGRLSASTRVEALASLNVTLASDVFLFVRR
jgi:23S rRNA (guanine745-N1)-methyltransferase